MGSAAQGTAGTTAPAAAAASETNKLIAYSSLPSASSSSAVLV